MAIVFIYNFELMLKSLIFIILLIPVGAVAQDSTKMNAVYGEIGGTGVYGSVGYERFFSINDNWTVCTRIGLSTLKFFDFNGKFNPDIILPISAGILYGKRHQAEFSFTHIITGIYEHESDPSKTWDSNGALTLGYRFNMKKIPLFTKVFYSPMLIRYETIVHWGGIGIGYKF